MAAVQPLPPMSRIEREVRRGRELLKQRQYQRALELGQVLLAEVPENRDVLCLVAVSQRCLGLVADALRTLERFGQAHPNFGRLYQEIGHCYRMVGQTDPAILAYQRAVGLNEVLEASWKGIAELCAAAGRHEEAQLAAHQVAQMSRLPRAVINAKGMLAEGEIYGAEAVLRKFLQTHGDHIEAMRLLAQIGVKLDVLDDAEFLLESVLVFAPDYHAARYDYANVLSQRHKHALSLEQARKLLQLQPRNWAYRIIYANSLVGLGEHKEALKIFRDLIAETPQNAEMHLSAAHALKTLGRQAEAIEAYRVAAAARPSFGDAYWSLANLKTYRFSDDELARMRELEAAPDIALVDRYHLCFALGKAMEDRAEYEPSFHYYARGNAFKKSESRHDTAALEQMLRRQIAVCTAEFFAARQGVGCDSSEPIFIVGLPRAGSTLLEQILASHSQVEGTTELAEIPRLAQRLSGRDHHGVTSRYPGVLAEIEPEQFKKFGEKYLADTTPYRTGKPIFIDKMPNNFRHIGLIHLVLPNARIIDARRNAMACCFSNFKQLFASGQEFTYSFEDIARYYRGYIEVMQHWDAVLPGKILRVRHEDVVEDLEDNVCRILEFCGLQFEQRCVEFFKTERSVRTASSEQVRQPIFKEGLAQWRHYEPWLGPLKDALGELVNG
ncbi:MAG: sulfotransferase [Steroidobacteraceae bacterium]